MNTDSLIEQLRDASWEDKKPGMGTMDAIYLDDAIAIIRQHTVAPDVVKAAEELADLITGCDDLKDLPAAKKVYEAIAVMNMGGESSRDVGETYNGSPPPAQPSEIRVLNERALDHAYDVCRISGVPTFTAVNIINAYLSNLPAPKPVSVKDFVKRLEMHPVDIKAVLEAAGVKYE